MDSVSVSSLKLALSRVRSLPSVRVGLRLLCSAAWVTWASLGLEGPHGWSLLWVLHGKGAVPAVQG